MSAKAKGPVKKRVFKRLVNISDDQKTVCKEANQCIYKLDQIVSLMIPIVEGSNQGQIDKILELGKKLDEIKQLIDSGL